MKKLFLCMASLSLIVACSTNDEPVDNDFKSEIGLSGKDDFVPTEEQEASVESEKNDSYYWNENVGGTYTVKVTDANGSMAYDVTSYMDAVDIAETTKKQKKELDKKIIKRAQIGFEVSNYGEEINRIKTLVSKYQGYISSENEESSNYRVGNSLTIRIPAQGLDKFIDELTTGPEKLDYKRVTAQDVTEEYVDIRARLKTKREVEARYSEILKKAKTIEEILRVENQLRAIREEIEAKEGRLKYLENLVGMSTVDLEVYQKLEYKYIPEKGKSFWARMAKSLDQGWKGLLSFIVGFTNLWPFWLILVGVFFIARRALRKLKARKSQ